MREYGAARMTIQLKPEQEDRIEQALRSGAYDSQEEVIDRALDALHAQDQWLTANRQAIDAKIRTGIQELEHGDGIPEEHVDEYLARFKARPE
jgi:Arc/MetJ-type ribon-helix-helix transcriptional regulator